MVNQVYKAIQHCRICGSDDLVSVLSLGNQELTGVFPRSRTETVTRGPLQLMWCARCSLVQLGHSYEASDLYGANYGYRSGLNQAMVRHLTAKMHHLEKVADLKSGDTVLDIGSNDATSLKAFTRTGVYRIGVDPTGEKFHSFYPPGITLIPKFFSLESVRKVLHRKAQIVTSIAMFYDLEDPIKFARDISEILDDNGIWHFEQSYLPSMLRLCSYDTVCHEHIEYYSMSSVKYVLDRADMKIIDVQMNAVNGGSFAVTAAKTSSSRPANHAIIDWLLQQELRMGLNTPTPYRSFEERVYRHREDFTRLLQSLKVHHKLVLGYGASTKGNVVLQFCGISPHELPAIAEVNQDKFGALTPGSYIPIISETEARAMKPDYFVVLPWHFKESITQREAEYLSAGGKIIFPFPEIEIV